MIAQHATERAIGPSVSSVVDSGRTPLVETRPSEGLKPTSPHKATGPRIEPPVSEPSAATIDPSATAAAAPEDDPQQHEPDPLDCAAFRTRGSHRYCHMQTPTCWNYQL